MASLYVKFFNVNYLTGDKCLSSFNTIDTFHVWIYLGIGGRKLYIHFINLITIGCNKVHPLWDKMRLMACVVSGNLMKVETFLQKQPVSLWHHGELGQYSTYKWTCYCRKRQINYIQSTLNRWQMSKFFQYYWHILCMNISRYIRRP
jgi:hypothetical protein